MLYFMAPPIDFHVNETEIRATYFNAFKAKIKFQMPAIYRHVCYKVSNSGKSFRTYGDFFSGKNMSPCYKVHKKIADQPCYNVIFYMRRTEQKY